MLTQYRIETMSRKNTRNPYGNQVGSGIYVSLVCPHGVNTSIHSLSILSDHRLQTPLSIFSENEIWLIHSCFPHSHTTIHPVWSLTITNYSNSLRSLPPHSSPSCLITHYSHRQTTHTAPHTHRKVSQRSSLIAHRHHHEGVPERYRSERPCQPRGGGSR